MLKRAQRIDRREFKKHFAAGARHHSQNFSVIHTPGGPFRGAVAVGKKVSGSAVVRNRLRRRAYACLAEFARTDGVSGCYIVLIKPPAATLSRHVFAEELAGLLAKAEKAR